MNALSADELEARLRDIGARRYHRLHPFHKLLHGDGCSKGQVQAWALNRYYYQAMIPIKDASLIARCEDSATRREWRSRLVDHDGSKEGEGGIILELYEWSHRHFPNLVDCRPIFVRRSLEAAGFRIESAEKKSMWVPVEIVLAVKTENSTTR